MTTTVILLAAYVSLMLIGEIIFALKVLNTLSTLKSGRTKVPVTYRDITTIYPPVE